MENQVAVPRKLWEHPDPKSTLMYEFMQDINRKSGQRLEVRDIAFVHCPCPIFCHSERHGCRTEDRHWMMMLGTQSHCLAQFSSGELK